MSGNKSSDIIVPAYDEDAQFPDSFINTPLAETPKRLPTTSFAKVVGSFLQNTKDRDVHSSPIKLSSLLKSPKLKSQLFSPANDSHPPRSCQRNTRRKSKINKAEEEFVEIKDVPKKSHLLTEHQKDVMREKKAIPLMYNSLDQSQDTQLFKSFSQDLSNSQNAEYGNIVSSSNQTCEKIDSKNIFNINSMKCTNPPLSDKKEDKVYEENLSDKKEKMCEENHLSEIPPSAEEENSFIPSSQTQESFSQLCCPSSIGRNQQISVDYSISPKEQLKDASAFQDLLRETTFQDLLHETKSNNTSFENEKKDEQTSVAGNLMCCTVESNKENAIIDEMFCEVPSENEGLTVNDNGQLTPNKLGKWLSANCVIELDKKTKSKRHSKGALFTKSELGKIVMDNGNDDAQNVSKTISMKYKRKASLTSEEVTRKKQCSKLVSAQIDNDDMVTPVLKIESEIGDLVDNAKVRRSSIKNKHTKINLKSRGERNSPFQKSNMYNYISGCETLKFEIKMKDVQIPIDNEDLSIDEDNIVNAKITLTSELNPTDIDNMALKSYIEMINNKDNTLDTPVDILRKNGKELKNNEKLKEENTVAINDHESENTIEMQPMLLEQNTLKLNEEHPEVDKDTRKSNEENAVLNINAEMEDICGDKGTYSSKSIENNIVTDEILPSSAEGIMLNINTLKLNGTGINSDQSKINKDISYTNNDIEDTLPGNPNILSSCSIPSTSNNKENLDEQYVSCLSPTSIQKSDLKAQESTTDFVEILNGDSKNPIVYNDSVSPIGNPPPTNASPTTGILKKKSFADQSPSPPSKNRRVSFQLPEGTTVLKADEEKEKCTVLCSKTKKQKNKTAKTCIYPELVECSIPIDKILPSITFSRGVGHLVRAQNILTVGDLSSLTEAQVENLPIRSPKLRTVRNALHVFSSQQTHAKVNNKSPLSMEWKMNNFSSPKKVDKGDAGGGSLLGTPSKHGDFVKPITLFHNTPIKEERKGILSPTKNSLSDKKEVEMPEKSKESIVVELTVDTNSNELINNEPLKNLINEVICEKPQHETIEKNTLSSKSVAQEINAIPQENNVELRRNDIQNVEETKVVDSSDQIKSILEEATGHGKELQKIHAKQDNGNSEAGVVKKEEDLNASFKFFLGKDRSEDISQTEVISPIKLARMETVNDSFEDASAEMDEIEEVTNMKNENIVDDSFINESFENAFLNRDKIENDRPVESEKLTNLSHNEDVLESSCVFIDQMEGITPINENQSGTVGNSSFEDPSREFCVEPLEAKDNGVPSPDAKSLFHTYNATDKKSLLTNTCGECTESTNTRIFDKDQCTSTKIDNVKDTFSQSAIEVLRATDFSKLPTTQIFDVLAELVGLNERAMTELKIRMYNSHDKVS